MKKLFIPCSLLAALMISACTAVAPPPTATLTPLPTPSPTPTATPTPIPIPTERYQTPGDYVDAVVVNGVDRWFTVHIPPGYQPGTPIALVINLHGRGSTPFEQEEVSRMNALASEEGFVVVAPQALGSPPTWWGAVPEPIGQPDMSFFAELMAYLQHEISIDPHRIYATGLSNGASMVNQLACEMPETFAAVASVSGGHIGFSRCQIEQPVSVLVIHGTADEIIPYEGYADLPPVRLWVEAWAERDGCDAVPAEAHPQDVITVETWSNCDAETEVVFISIEGGGHTWPGYEVIAGYNTELDATAAVWEFFSAHPRLPSP